MTGESSAVIRRAAVRVLESRGFTVTNVARGVGSPPYSAVEAVKGSETFRCLIKATTRPQGRIHFERTDRNDWKSLSRATHVLHAWCHPDTPDMVAVSLFDASIVIAAFEKNFLAKTANGMAHIPCWISPVKENGWKFDGSGYGSKTIWSQNISLSYSSTTERTFGVEVVPTIGSITQIYKEAIAAQIGVQIDLIEIDIRVKL